jgi:hypothetical protein
MLVLFPLKLAVAISNTLSRLKSKAISEDGSESVEYAVWLPKFQVPSPRNIPTLFTRELPTAISR